MMIILDPSSIDHIYRSSMTSHAQYREPVVVVRGWAMLMRGSRVTWLMARSSHFHFVPDRFIFIGSSYSCAGAGSCNYGASVPFIVLIILPLYLCFLHRWLATANLHRGIIVDAQTEVHSLAFTSLS